MVKGKVGQKRTRGSHEFLFLIGATFTLVELLVVIAHCVLSANSCRPFKWLGEFGPPHCDGANQFKPFGIAMAQLL